MRTLLILLLCYWAISVKCQVPASLVQERSVIILDFPLQEEDGFLRRGNWKEQAAKIQSSLEVMGVDGIGYLHRDDFAANEEIKQSFLEFFKTRGIKNVLTFSKNERNLFTIEIEDFENNMAQWSAEGGSLDQVLFRMGKAIKQADHTVENFLVLDEPTFFNAMPVSKWTATERYPSHIMRLTLGVEKFDDEAKNERLKQILAQYPFKYNLIDYTTDENAYRQGYEFVLLNISTSGQSIKKLLNYESGIKETHYISTVARDSADTEIKTIPVDALVHKYYFRRTVNHQVYVGEKWDADTSWHSALRNFIRNIRIAFKKN